MPELPEVETTLRGITPHVRGKQITAVVVRQRRLRQTVSRNLHRLTAGQRIRRIKRRAKYLLFELDSGHLIVHLGMSGSLRIAAPDAAPRKHDHVDVVLGGCILRFHDPRRFGSVLWTSKDPLRHKLLRDLGPEPLGDDFTGRHLYALAQARRIHVKGFLMNGRVVAGLGNIYANEALFLGRIHPQRAAGRISLARYQHLADGIKQVLHHAIEAGGTTLRDFVREDGKPGYFANHLNVYDREGQPCPNCKTPIKARVLGQRSSFFCGKCQR